MNDAETFEGFFVGLFTREMEAIISKETEPIRIHQLEKMPEAGAVAKKIMSQIDSHPVYKDPSVEMQQRVFGLCRARLEEMVAKHNEEACRRINTEKQIQ